MKLFTKISVLVVGLTVILSSGWIWAKNQLSSHKYIDVSQYEKKKGTDGRIFRPGQLERPSPVRTRDGQTRIQLIPKEQI